MKKTIGLAILERVIAPERATFSEDVARAMLAWDFAGEDQTRVEHLSSKAQDGTLTLSEREELEEYVRVGNLLALIDPVQGKTIARQIQAQISVHTLKSSRITATLDRTIRERAGGTREYCRFPQAAFRLRFPIDHIIARQHGGRATAL